MTTTKLDDILGPTENVGSNFTPQGTTVAQVDGPAMKLPTVHLSKPFSPYGRDTAIQRVTYRDAGHVPGHMTKIEADRAKASLECQFDRNAVNGDVAIRAAEIISDKNGTRRTKEIHATIPREQAEQIARFILTGTENKP